MVTPLNITTNILGYIRFSGTVSAVNVYCIYYFINSNINYMYRRQIGDWHGSVTRELGVEEDLARLMDPCSTVKMKLMRAALLSKEFSTLKSYFCHCLTICVQIYSFVQLVFCSIICSICFICLILFLSTMFVFKVLCSSSSSTAIAKYIL